MFSGAIQHRSLGCFSDVQQDHWNVPEVMSIVDVIEVAWPMAE